jgi:hypothetical protein
MAQGMTRSSVINLLSGSYAAIPVVDAKSTFSIESNDS